METSKALHTFSWVGNYSNVTLPFVLVTFFQGSDHLKVTVPVDLVLNTNC